MEKIIRYCDHCGKGLGNKYSQEIMTTSQFLTIDLCEKCEELLDKTIIDFVRKAQQSTQTKEIL